MKKAQQFYSYLENPVQLKRKVSSPREAGEVFIAEVLEVDDPVYLTERGLAQAGGDYHLVLEGEKKVKDLTAVSFRQMIRKIPVWDAGISVVVSDAYRICQASVSYRRELKEVAGLKQFSEDDFEAYQKKIDPDFIAAAIDLERNALRLKQFRVKPSDIKISITTTRPVVYQYHEEERQHTHGQGDEKGLFSEIPHLQLPGVDEQIEDGGYYGAIEVLFSTTMPWGELPWRMMVDIGTGSVLYLRILADNLNGFVFDNDPITLSGDVSITPATSNGVLNTLRAPRPLPGLSLSNPQSLSGEYVALTELLAPVILPPNLPGGQDFNFDADTDNFSAVNAYYHNDALFRMVEEMGFDMNTYFDGTVANPGFPVPVDHRGFLGLVNACAPGNAGGDGSGGFHYGVVQAGEPVGIATAWRIVLHEFGHAILWDNVHSPNFGFAHSAGDSLAAVLSDPRSKAPDRFMTFPWLTTSNPGIDRRHDRDVSAGWAWGGALDTGGYNSEQILSTTHFRLYRALGGDHPELAEREFAARYVAYLIFYSTGLLAPATNPNSPEEWALYLQLSDVFTSNFEGQPRACVYKVIRWAFEKQGAYQPTGAPVPVTTEGAPPPVDVFINDGRNGEYYFSQDIYDSTDIWNRHSPDGHAAHQKPLVGQSNYAYVMVRNRGTQTATNVTVQGFRNTACCCGNSNLEKVNWPDSFSAIHTPSLSAPDIPANSYAMVGPFEWVPESENEELAFAVSANGDPANINWIPSGEKVALNHVLPFDNNMALRKCR